MGISLPEKKTYAILDTLDWVKTFQSCHFAAFYNDHDPFLYNTSFIPIPDNNGMTDYPFDCQQYAK